MAKTCDSPEENPVSLAGMILAPKLSELDILLCQFTIISLSTSINGDPAVPLGGQITDSVDCAEIEIPPPFQVAVAVVSVGFVNSK